MEQFVNKVAESGIVTLDLANYIPLASEMAVFDLKPFLYMEMILKEKNYREALQKHDWQQYTDKHVAILCSADAIVPVWAYMLVASYLHPISRSVYFGNMDELNKALVLNKIAEINKEEYIDKRVVIKGCGDTPIPEFAYVAVTSYLRDVVKSLMYGEPCSTVPIYKKPKDGQPVAS